MLNKEGFTELVEPLMTIKWGWREIIKNNEEQKKKSLNGHKEGAGRGGGKLGREQGRETQIKEESCGREELWKLWRRFQHENHHHPHPHALKIRLAEQEEQHLTDPLQRAGKSSLKNKMNLKKKKKT